MVGLLVAAILLVFLGDHAIARVAEFSWQERTVGADNAAFVMVFNRPMKPRSVEANLTITPRLPGRVSWAGRRMAYTLDVPIPYGETFEVKLPKARDRFSQDPADTQFEAFTGTFHSRDRAMAYIGTQGDEAGRLVLINFSQGGTPLLLTPPDLTVLDFEPYPLGDRLLFSAVKKTVAQADTLTPVLYTVTTGLRPNPPDDWQGNQRNQLTSTSEAAVLTRLLDSDVYQNLAFDLSPDGQVVVVQRVNKADAQEFGLWILREGDSPERLETEVGGEFLIGPDSQTLLMLQGQGTAVIPLAPDESETTTQQEPLDFLPKHGRIFDVSRDGSAAAMVDFNQNDPERRFTESLELVTNQGEEIELLNTTGAIVSARFDPTNEIIYALASDLLSGEVYREQPFLMAVNLQTREPLKLLSLPPQARVSMSLSPDGLAILMAVAVPSETNAEGWTEQMILLPLFATTEERLAGTPVQTMPQVLPYSGLLATWLP